METGYFQICQKFERKKLISRTVHRCPPTPQELVSTSIQNLKYDAFLLDRVGDTRQKSLDHDL